MATTDTNRLEGLPLELLEKIIEQLPARDIPRAGEVSGIQHVHMSIKAQTNR